jgi:hypothetical protein
MRAQHYFSTELLIGLMVLGFGCDGTMHTGTAKKPANNKPAADGTCPSERSLCGTGTFAICVDLLNDPEHCGICDRACSPGIACEAGVCEQTVCSGSAIPFSGQPKTTDSDPSAIYWVDTQELLTDVNGDGHLDLVDWTVQFTTEDLSAFRVSLGQPGGGFAPPDTYHASADVLQILATDLNNDGFDDLYVLASAIDVNAAFSPYRVELWLGHGDGHLSRSDAALGSGPKLGLAVAFADLSGDGWPDLVMQTPDTNSDHPGSLDLYLSDSTGALHLSKSYTTGWGSIGRTFIWDWNGDGSPDIAEIQDSILILFNRGDGTFDPPVDCAVGLGVGGVGDVLVEDFNRDGRMDLAMVASNSRIGVMLGFGGCGFSPLRYYDVPGIIDGFLGGFLRAADMNGDGQLDIVSISTLFASNPSDPNGFSNVVEGNLLAVLLGKPDGTFQPQDAVISLGPGLISDVVVGEVSGDKRPDIVVSSPDGQTRAWENTCQ